jgi:hypothetical protein
MLPIIPIKGHDPNLMRTLLKQGFEDGAGFVYTAIINQDDFVGPSHLIQNLCEPGVEDLQVLFLIVYRNDNREERMLW